MLVTPLTDLQTQMSHIWQSYLDWSLEAPLKRKVMAQLFNIGNKLLSKVKQVVCKPFVT